MISTDSAKDSVLRCIEKANVRNFPDVVRKSQGLLQKLLRSTICRKVKINGPAINLSIMTVNCFKQIFLADFTFAVPCFEWPPESDWLFRNKIWHDHKVVATIMNRGFHFVPRNKDNDKSNFT